MAWLPGLSLAGERDPCAASLGQLADRSLEEALGAYPVDDAGFWPPRDFSDVEDLATEIGEHPSAWTDVAGKFIPRERGGSVAGAGVYLPAPEWPMQGAIWGEAEEDGDVGMDRCRAPMPVPGPYQTVATVALLAFRPGLVGI